MENKNNLIAIIQARLSSSRLHEKVVMKIGEESLLGWCIKRAICAPAVTKVVVATSNLPEDDLVAKQAEESGADIIRGSLENVLERFCMAIEKYKPEHIVRLTADNPLVDEKGFDLMIKKHLEDNNDYTTLGGEIPIGTGGEIIKTTALKIVCNTSHDLYEQEHVTPYIYTNRDRFKCGVCKPPHHLHKNAGLRLTVDTKEDLQLLQTIEKLLSEKGIFFNCENALELINQNRSLLDINRSIPQKKRLS